MEVRSLRSLLHHSETRDEQFLRNIGAYRKRTQRYLQGRATVGLVALNLRYYPGCDPRPVHVGFVVDTEIVTGFVSFLRVAGISPVSIIPRMFYTGRFIMYSRIIKICCRKTVGHVQGYYKRNRHFQCCIETKLLMI